MAAEFKPANTPGCNSVFVDPDEIDAEKPSNLHVFHRSECAYTLHQSRVAGVELKLIDMSNTPQPTDPIRFSNGAAMPRAYQLHGVLKSLGVFNDVSVGPPG